MKRLLLFTSAIFNIVFILIFGFLILRRGGFSYIKKKLGLRVENNVSLTKPEWYYLNSQHWEVTRSLYKALPNDSCEIIFLGNSITYECEWAELFSNPRIKNRGIRGDNTEGILERLTEITESNPCKVFIEIGTNDIALGYSISYTCLNYIAIIDRIKLTSPLTEIYVQSILPTNNDARNNDSIRILNSELKKIAKVKGIIYINLFDAFTDSNGNLNMKYSRDGLHLNTAGYLIWREAIKSYIK